MKLKTQRWIDRWVGQLLCAGASLWHGLKSWGQPQPVLCAEPRHILVILLSEMGAVVLAGPMFAALRQRYPGAAVHVLQLKKNQEVARLLGLARPENLHAIDDSSGMKLLADIWRVSRALRRLPLDAVVDCELFSRISALLSLLSGATVRAGFTPHTQEGLYRGNFINRAIPYNPYVHISQQFVSLVDALESPSKPRNKAAPARIPPVETGLSVAFDAVELRVYRDKMSADFPVFTTKKLVLIYAGGGILPERAWPVSHYAVLAQELCRAGHAVGLIGLREDAALARDLRNTVQSESCQDLTGYTRSIRELLMLLHNAQLLITNDGGPGHFASLTPVSCMVFFGPETSRLYAPLGSRTRILECAVACSPCLSAYNHRQTFCDGDNQCLKRLPPQSVIEQALALLAAPGQASCS